MTTRRRKWHTPEQIVRKLLDADAMLNPKNRRLGVGIEQHSRSIWAMVATPCRQLAEEGVQP
jgi:hypothetical protein